MKVGKAARMDEIPNEVWKYKGIQLKEWTWFTCNRIWRRDGWPELWKEGIVVPASSEKKEKGRKKR